MSVHVSLHLCSTPFTRRAQGETGEVVQMLFRRPQAVRVAWAAAVQLPVRRWLTYFHHMYLKDAFSPGSTVGAATMEESLARIADCINRAHQETESVIIVLENMVHLVCQRYSRRDSRLTPTGWFRQRRWIPLRRTRADYRAGE